MKNFLWLLLLLLTPAAAQPQGEFLVGTHDGEGFFFTLNFHDQSVRMQSANEALNGEAKLEKVTDGVFRFQLERPDETAQITIIEVNQDEIVVASPAESEVMRGLKVASIPEWLTGSWNLEGTQEGVTFTEQGAVIHKKSGEVEATIRAVASDGPISRLLVIQGPAAQDSKLYSFILTDNDSMLIWDHDDGQTKRLVRQK